MMKYRDDMTPEETAAFMAALDAEYPADADQGDRTASAPCDEDCPGCPECLEMADPMRDGWIGKDGRP